MFERFASEKQILNPTQNEISRRSFLRAGGLALAAAATPSSLRLLAESAGQLYDSIASPEDIISQPVSILEPREDDTPVVSPQPRGESTGIQTKYTQNSQAAVLSLPSNIPLRAEHTNTPLEASMTFTSAGAAIITTAEGLVEGEQAYCMLFKMKEQVIAVGYEGGLYMYEPTLGQSKTKTGGEWVRVVTQDKDGTLPSHVATQTPWRELESVMPHKMLIQNVVEGTETLQSIGYKPWAAVLPSTRMPDMKQYTFTPAACAQNTKEVLEGNKPYFITENGEVIDLNHLQAKAGETLSLFTQLQYQHIAGEIQPVASVEYSAGSSAKYEFSVHPDSLQPDMLPDTTFSIMNTVTTLMEGVSQRYAIEKIPVVGAWSRSSGMSHEDIFTNSLGITGMLSLMHEYKLAEKLNKPLRTVHRNNPHVPAKAIQEALEHAIEDVKPLLVKLVLEQTARTYGVRKLEAPLSVELPKGIYPLIPTKINNKDGATPTRIAMQSANVTTNNPNVRYKPTNVPAIQTAVGHLLARARL